jgi:2-oxoglutarate ferredoxin oxidoreductase subunit beta
MNTLAVAEERAESAHPLEGYLRGDRLPHIWCAGCGLGIVVSTFIRAMLASKLDPDKVAVVSGIGCTGRIAGYLKLDSFHTTHGRPIPFATGLKLANPELDVVVISGDGDLAAIGGNHLIHAGRRNIDITVICVNNFTYGMTGGQFGPTTPSTARSTTSRRGNIENPFNMVALAGASGAPYVARWASHQVRQMEKSFSEAFAKKGLSFVEIVSPCPTYFGRMNRQPTGLDQMRHYKSNTVVRHGMNPAEVPIGLTGEIVTGKFIDVERPYLPMPAGEGK